MIVELAPKNRNKLKSLFDGYFYQSVFMDGTIEGEFGKAWADSADSPKVAMLNHVLTYIAGNATIPEAKELLRIAVTTSESLFVFSKEWGELIQSEYADKYIPVEWTSLTSKSIDAKHIKKFIEQVPLNFEVKRIGEKIANLLFYERVLIYRIYDK